jgi:TRAP-type C4-dicarboxylate transport system permease small subunit
LNRTMNTLTHILNIAMSIALLIMVVLIFGNVLLRYVFNSGIVWSEELSRYLFIWLVFLGAIGALKDNEHLGIDSLVKRLPRPMKKVVYVIGNLVVLYILWLILDGSWKMTAMSVDDPGPSTGIPMAYVNGVGILMSVSMAIIILVNLFRALFEKGAIDQLTRLKESEEEILSSLHEDAQTDARGDR